MKFVICIDIPAVYFTAKTLRIGVEYSEMLSILREELRLQAGDTVDVHGFTTCKESYKAQEDFLASLSELGIVLHKYPTDVRGPYTAEMLAVAIAADAREVVIVSNDAASVRAGKLLEDGPMIMTVAYFSTDLPTGSLPALLNDEVGFIDFAKEPLLSRILRKKRG